MVDEKRPAKELVGKIVVTKEGKNLGEVQDITFETRTGECVHVILKNPTRYALELGLEKNTERNYTVPYNSIIAIGDFVVVAEEDIV
ncbi:MAG: PRC-barrel domain-containing protein [Nanoarchaeota archaeon]